MPKAAAAATPAKRTPVSAERAPVSAEHKTAALRKANCRYRRTQRLLVRVEEYHRATGDHVILVVQSSHRPSIVHFTCTSAPLLAQLRNGTLTVEAPAPADG